MDKIAVLIPCYNEEKSIEKVVQDFREALPEAVIYVYDNNSSDRTAEIARQHGATVYEYSNPKENTMGFAFKHLTSICLREVSPNCFMLTLPPTMSAHSLLPL